MRDGAARDSFVETLCILALCIAGMLGSSHAIQTWLPSPETPRLIVRVLGVAFELRVPL